MKSVFILLAVLFTYLSFATEGIENSTSKTETSADVCHSTKKESSTNNGNKIFLLASEGLTSGPNSNKEELAKQIICDFEKRLKSQGYRLTRIKWEGVNKFLTDHLMYFPGCGILLGDQKSLKEFASAVPELSKKMTLKPLDFRVEGGNLLRLMNVSFHGQTPIGCYVSDHSRSRNPYRREIYRREDHLDKKTHQKITRLLEGKSTCYPLFLNRELQQARVDYINFINTFFIKTKPLVWGTVDKSSRRYRMMDLLSRYYYHMDMYTTVVGHNIFVLNKNLFTKKSYELLKNKSEEQGYKLIDLEHDWYNEPMSINSVDISNKKQTCLAIGKVTLMIKKKFEDHRVVLSLMSSATFGRAREAGIHCAVCTIQVNHKTCAKKNPTNSTSKESKKPQREEHSLFSLGDLHDYCKRFCLINASIYR